MSDGAAFADKKPATQAGDSFNRLSIAHLLLWMTMTAIALVTEQRQSLITPFDDSLLVDPVYSEFHAKWKLTCVLRLIVTPANGAAMAVTAVALWRVILRRSAFLKQPGQWLLLVVTAQYIPTLIGWSSINLTTWSWWTLFMANVMFLVPAIVAVVAAIHSEQRRWRASFVLLSIGYGSCAIGIAITYGLRDAAVIPGLSLLTVIPALILIAAYVCGMAASIWDLRAREERDIFYWIGCVVLWAVFAESTASWLIWEWK